MTANISIPLNSAPFADAVAARCSREILEVASVLAKHGIVPSPSPPPAKPLRIARIAFKGQKILQGKTDEIDFAWDIDDDGLFVIVTNANLRGKTTILQVALWALRGTIKNLTTTVQNWIKSVDVTFLADQREIRVTFSVSDGGETGQVTVRAANTPDADARVHSFADGAQFKRAMEEVMLEALALEPIPASRTTGDRTTAYDDGWAAYTGAFLTDSKSNAIIGEHIGTDLTQRLLQVFVGLPWARTLFQSRAQKNVLESEMQQRRRKLSALGGRSLDELEGDLTAIKNEIEDEALRNGAAERLLQAQREYDIAAQEVREALGSLISTRQGAEEARAERLNAEKVLREMEEERAAAAFFGRLSPKCCPRCSSAIPKERLEREVSEHACSVCLESVPTPDDSTVQAEIDLAKRRWQEAKGLETDVVRLVTKRDQEHKQTRASLKDAGLRLQSLAATGTAGDLQVLERRRERLEGMLEVASAIVNADQADSGDIAILRASEEEASIRLTATAGHVLARASEEITRIVRRLGMSDVESIELKRNAHVQLQKGGTPSSWGGLSAGEQLRLRIATVIALVRTAQDYGVGRHPGLLLIDSPGNEEVADENLADMLDELKKVAEETSGLQMFVALQGAPDRFSDLPTHHVRSAGSGEYLW